MKPKDILFQALEREKSERTPWVPFVGSHAAKLLDFSAEKYLKDEQLIIDGVSRAIELYQPDGIPVMFDLQIEAEALGCDFKWADDNPPTVTGHPLQGELELEDLSLPTAEDARYPIVLKAMEELNDKYGEEIALYGLITGPFTLALHLLGSEIFMSMYDDPEYVHRLLDFCKEVGQKTASMYIEAGMDVIAVVDPMVSQISPTAFNNFVAGPVREIFELIEEKRAYSSLFVCGNAQPNIEEMCKCQPDNISIDENIPLDYVRDKCQEYDVSFGGNMELTTVLLMGSENKCKRHALECMEIGGEEGYILAPGCDIPYDVAPENLMAVTEVVHNKEAYDLMEMEIDDEEEVDIELPDYDNLDKVLIEIFTLDSKACAPCQYMVNSVYEAISDNLKQKVELREYKIKEKEAVSRMKKLGVQSIPSVLIDGEVKYDSVTPSKEELKEEIMDAVSGKLGLAV
ncbi:MAG: uroporphyrinogen decarboxylase family protein [Halanaerobiaceae bacterium]